MLRSSSVLKVMCLMLGLGLGGCSPRAPKGVVSREAPAVDAAEVAADRLRARLTEDDGEGCAAEGAALVEQHPGSGRARAWWLACVARTGRNLEAAALADRWVSERPGDAWALWARMAVWHEESEPARPLYLAGTATLIEALAGHPDAVRLRAAALAKWGHGDELMALAAAHPTAPRWARAVARLRTGDATQLPLALADAHEVAETDPEFVTTAALLGAELLRANRVSEALAWVDRGLARAPDSLQLRRQRWWLLQLQPREPADRKRDVLEDISSTLARTGERPAVLLAAAETYRFVGEEGLAGQLEARIAGEFADSPAAEALLARRNRALTGANPYASAKPTAAQLEAQRTADEAFLARPRLHDPLLREEAALRRFEATLADPAKSAAEVVAAIDAARPLVHKDLREFLAAAARALIDRGAELERAEALVRQGLQAVANEVAAAQARGHAFQGMDGWLEGGLYDLLARVRLAERRVRDAEAALAEANKRGSQGDDHALAQAELTRLRGDADEADRILVACSDAYDGDPGDDPCRRGLAAAWQRAHGGLAGLDAHVAKMLARTREQRRQAVFAAIAAEPKPAPEFRFTRLDGGVVSSESTRGKLVVLHFWFTTCEPCVEELPRWQEFVDAHAKQRDVEVLSVHAIGSPDEVQAWLGEHPQRFPVAMSDGYCERAMVWSFPTTWFLDRQGRIAYVSDGAGPDLPLEFAWRVEGVRAAERGRAG
ncbi:TlpA disulfide reductase family protein [Nannocystis punicea]|uniref:TlpA disulfide reductase family protein n=1 Tax=Nannocystis punicea TaxID=2995304 RepID=A0ABY7GU57_9BACT|nr:TlpA disulfide reductase family protein [Nannocystis poenicansa]WAS90454.1 TlpA disulfide reductase family protein [Nannocystis poenicansa]